MVVMSKGKPQESHSSGSKKKRKKLSSEREICLEEKMDKKVKKKRKKSETEEEPPISTCSQPGQDDTQTGTTPQNHKPAAEHTQTEKKRKKKRVKIAEPTSVPSVTQAEDGVELGDGVAVEDGVTLEDLSPEERRVLERKVKKMLKKNKLKTEEKTDGNVDATKPIAPQQALDYLTCWAENRKEWKFQKTRQTWLLQHMFDSDKVPDQSFSVLLSYLEGLRGAARDTTVQKAEALVQGAETEEDEAQKTALRAREVIQLLS